MAIINSPIFTFRSAPFDGDFFEVVSFHGEEGISQLYWFDILLLSAERDLDVGLLAKSACTLAIKPPFSGATDRVFTGFPTSVTCLQKIQDFYLYRVRMHHKLWRLGIGLHSRVLVGAAPVEFIRDSLEKNGFFSDIDFALRLNEQYSRREMVCQYNESMLAFISRWLEDLGIYYWFEHSGLGSICVLADSNRAHKPVPGFEKLLFAPPSGMTVDQQEAVITHFTQESRPLPQELRLKNYNPQKPSLDMNVSATVSDKGLGTFYTYGESYHDPLEGEKLAKVRAEALSCREHIYSGISHCAGLCSGHTFRLDRHFRPEWNQGYLTTSVWHEGSQARSVIQAYSLSGLEEADGLFYRNEFSCIPSSVQYRPLRTTPRPRVYGVLTATIDAEGSGDFAELDSQGRYKIVLPFDTEKRGGGKASCWVSLMQPYAGPRMGFHAPLHKGTEVLVVFLDGNPDLPVIAGAVPNPETPNMVTDRNATQIRLDSALGFKLHITDEPGRASMLLSNPDGKSFIKIT